MKTFQDLRAVGENPALLMDFIRSAIREHKSSEMYEVARIADLYDRHKNVTINDFQKLLYTVTGEAVPDNFSANWKMATRFFHRFILQEVQYLLGNGVQWGTVGISDRLGDDFDTRLQEAGKQALIGGVSFGFFNYDHLQVFSLLEFVPLYDEEDGGLKAGIRFWQVDQSKPLRATLYEIDGYSDFIWRKDKQGEVLKDKRPYITTYTISDVDGTEILDFENYPSFPIVPLWGNSAHQSEFVGLREQIDCYDLIKSGLANDIDDASMIYWTIQNAGGMDDIDLARFVEHMKTVKASVVDSDGATAEAHTLDVPFEAREALLDRISKDIYRDAMALDTENIANGAVTATQIRAAYEPLNSKCDDFEYCVIDFLTKILNLLGFEREKPTFTRSVMVNVSEEVQTVISAAPYLGQEYVTQKIMNILGDGEKAEEMIRQMIADDYGRLNDLADE